MTIPAAGTVPWRRHDGALQVALVHRPKYDDWSWTKGKLDPAEEWPVAAVRETLEETGLRVRLGAPLPETAYRVLGRDGAPATKQVRYWAAAVTGGEGHLVNEIDEVAWLDAKAAHERLDYAHDREQLRAVLRADQIGRLDTWPLAIVRHAHAVGRGSWRRADHKRPLDAAGLARVEVITGILAAYGILEVVTSPSRRCVQTVAPYAAAAHLKLQTKRALSEEGFAARGKRPVTRLIRTLVEFGAPVAVCSHGPVLPTILGLVRRYAVPSGPGDGEGDGAAAGTPGPVTPTAGVSPPQASPAQLLKGAGSGSMDKGEVLVAHLSGVGTGAVVVAVERHRL